MKRITPIIFVCSLAIRVLAQQGASAAPTYCAQATALQTANVAFSRLSDVSAPTYPKAHIAAYDKVIVAMRALESMLKGDQKAIMTANRKQTEKLRATAAKAKTATEQTQREIAVLIDGSSVALKSLEAIDKLYPVIDAACGTNVGNRNLKLKIK